MNRRRKPIYPIILLFVVLNAFFIAGRSLLERKGFSQDVLLLGNVFLFFLTIGSFLMAQKGLANKNPHAFVRSIYGSIMMKLFLSLIVAFIYIATQRKGLNKPAFFTLMGLYLVYTAIEVTTLTRMLRDRSAS
ncbi:hypothetical protein [Flaviaesturariibacter aridisoli]|uniref:ATP synthase subunit I n=1 Tax=Flaviaesturariibacter aridisoli TaxID=2545761 RepID=A0A4R4E9Q8_9BACT|nr:hypothetical protein [Flaviaesturariibacter aridisoli]TCZ74545.1 hypothetical protein E0486_02660 [Flaviaesturariibacter aridisoli]